MSGAGNRGMSDAGDRVMSGAGDKEERVMQGIEG
jgi:hypothetical protein